MQAGALGAEYLDGADDKGRQRRQKVNLDHQRHMADQGQVRQVRMGVVVEECHGISVKMGWPLKSGCPIRQRSVLDARPHA